MATKSAPPSNDYHFATHKQLQFVAQAERQTSPGAANYYHRSVNKDLNPDLERYYGQVVDPLLAKAGYPAVGSSQHHNVIKQVVSNWRDEPIDEKIIQKSNGGKIDRLNMSHKDVTQRIPQLTEAAQKLGTDEMTPEMYQELVNKHKPVYPWGYVPSPATYEEISGAVRENQRPAVGKGHLIPEGHPVGLRLDIPAYKDYGVWAPTIHDRSGGKSTVLAHEPAAHILNAEFSLPETKALRVAQGTNKSPFATIDGTWKPTHHEEIRAMAEAYLNHPEWSQVGMDPERHSYFYDRRTQQPITHADEVLQIGPLVLAKNARTNKSKEEFAFADGGSAEYIPHNDKRRARNLKDFHGKTPKEIREGHWFHGTDQNFSLFRPGSANAIYLTQNPEFSEKFAMKNYNVENVSPNIMPVHVRAEKPFDYENKKHIAALYETLGPDLIMDPYLHSFMDEVREGHWGAIESAPIQNAIKAMGHDSFYVKEHGAKNLAVYDPSQIKSATGNQGTFDPSNPDITKASGGDVEGRNKNLAAFLEGNHPDVPKIAYHATNKDFSSFLPMSHFGTKKAAMSRLKEIDRPNHNIMPVHLSIKNPLNVGEENRTWMDNADVLNQIAEKLVHMGHPEHAARVQSISDDIMDNDPKDQTPHLTSAANILSSLGYDGIKYINKVEDRGSYSFIPLFPNQIKSAIGNQGTFDPSDPDITKRDGGDVEGEGITAYHGSPHDFEQFDTSKIGTGEGAQAYGHGLYFAQAEPTAKGYRNALSSNLPGGMRFSEDVPENMQEQLDALHSEHGYLNFNDMTKRISGMARDLSRKAQDVWENHWLDDEGYAERESKKLQDQASHYERQLDFLQKHENRLSPKHGRMYEVHINARPEHFLDWDKPIREQPHVMKAIDEHIGDPDIVIQRLFANSGEDNPDGGDFHTALGGYHKPEAVAQKLASMGFRGIQYLDAGSRNLSPAFDPVHIERQIAKNRAIAQTTGNERQKRNLDNDYEILKKRLEDVRAEKHLSRNYVIFDHNHVKVRRKYEQGGFVPEAV